MTRVWDQQGFPSGDYWIFNIIRYSVLNVWRVIGDDYLCNKFHQFFNTLIFCASLSCKWILKCSILIFHALLYLERFYVLHCAESKMTVWRVAVSLFALWSFNYWQIAIKHLISILKRGFYIWIRSFDGWDTALSGENGNLPLLRRWALNIGHMTGLRYDEIWAYV